MKQNIILASGSETRQAMLTNAGVAFTAISARIDEEAIRTSMLAENVNATEIADALAEAKAKKISRKHPQSLVIGCDQMLELSGNILSKPMDRTDAIQQLTNLNGKKHKLHSAVVIYYDGQPQWRHVGTVRMHMRRCTSAYLSEYLERNWESIRHCVGCYKLEEEGVRLFSRIEGDYFSVLGLPLIELLACLTKRGVLPE